MSIQVGDLVRLKWDPDTLQSLNCPTLMKVGLVTELHEPYNVRIVFETRHLLCNKHSLEVVNERR
jgi:hypothetical protein